MQIFERELLIRPFGFKGGALSELWQVASYLEVIPASMASDFNSKRVMVGCKDIFLSFRKWWQLPDVYPYREGHPVAPRTIVSYTD
jgi:hypothetical protein